MSETDDLYQELILDHYKNPRNYGELPGANRHASGHNPLCGDKLVLGLLLDGDGVIRDVKFQGQGCAISKASASLMTGAVKGLKAEQAEKLFARFHDLVTGRLSEGEDLTDLGKLSVMSGVKEYPARVKCASLCWHTLHAALQGGEPTVSTE
jgi:nitrogen fixation protein NifU and related proteins